MSLQNTVARTACLSIKRNIRGSQRIGNFLFLKLPRSGHALAIWLGLGRTTAAWLTPIRAQICPSCAGGFWQSVTLKAFANELRSLFAFAFCPLFSALQLSAHIREHQRSSVLAYVASSRASHAGKQLVLVSCGLLREKYWSSAPCATLFSYLDGYFTLKIPQKTL